MAIKASGGNPPQNSLKFSEIEAEFGQNNSRSLGDYRMNNLNIGALTEVSLSRDGCGINANSDIPCLLYTSPSPRDLSTSRMPSSA